MQYLIDKVIVPCLQFNISSNFKGLLEVMEKADDQKIVSIAHKLGMCRISAVMTVTYIINFITALSAEGQWHYLYCIQNLLGYYCTHVKV